MWQGCPAMPDTAQLTTTRPAPAATVPLTSEQAGSSAKILLNKREISARLGLPPRTLDRLTANGVLPCLRITRKLIRFEENACLKALRAYETATLRK